MLYGAVVAGRRAAVASRGNLVHGLFISSSVIPSVTFVIPITGGSPFFTNS